MTAALLTSIALAVPPTGAVAYHPVTNYLAFVGGTAGKANPKLSPIYVGVVNQQGGSEDIAPEWTTGAELAQSYLNDDLGGIDGHPVKLVTCFIPDTVSNAESCGQQMANDSQVSAVAVGPITIGNSALEDAMAPRGKVIVWGISTSPTDETYRRGFALFGDDSHVEGQFATFIKKYLKATSVSIVYENIPGGSIGPDITSAALAYAGIKSSNIHVVGYDPSTTDLTVPLEAADASTSSVVFADVNGPACANIYKAIQELGVKTKVIANVTCISSQIQTADGGTLPQGWYYGSAIPFYNDKTDPSGPAFLKVASKFGDASYASDAWVENAFSEVLTISKWDTSILKSHEKITPAAVFRQGRAQTAPVPFSAPSLVCGTIASAPIVCNDRDSFFQNTAPNVFKVVARWILAPTGFKVPAGLE
jgi:branched-chain amino acid transport system substrate-binding protein